jgi:hypothetical protein
VLETFAFYLMIGASYSAMSLSDDLSRERRIRAAYIEAKCQMPESTQHLKELLGKTDDELLAWLAKPATAMLLIALMLGWPFYVYRSIDKSK